MQGPRYEEIHDWEMKRIVVYHAIRSAAESEGEQESDGAFLMYGVHNIIARALDIEVQGAYSTWVPWLLGSKILSVAQEAVVQSRQQYRFTPVEGVPSVEEYKEFEDDVDALSRNYWEWKRRAERLSATVPPRRPKEAPSPPARRNKARIKHAREAVISSEGDRLLDITEAAEMLCVSVDYLYRHWQRFPFTFKLPGGKQIKFSLRGIQMYLAHMLEEKQNELHGRGDDEC